jgi:cystathionine beta-synthase
MNGKKPRYHQTILEAIGGTPLVRLRLVASATKATVLAKVESFNPGGSVKDRIGYQIIERYEKEGRLKPGGTIVECTSGNTGVGLAMVAAVKGYKAVFVMPDKMSKEKIRLLKAYGAEVVITPTAVPPESPESYYSVARRIAEETPGGVLANQYYNDVNPESHYLTTGPEIWEQTGGKVGHFVSTIGTGGTISGTGRYLKEKNPKLRVVGVDPEGSIIKHYFDTGEIVKGHTYLTEGIGEDIIPGTFKKDFVDTVVQVSDRESLNMAREISRREGILVGGSSGSAVAGAVKYAADLPEGEIVVVILPDTGERYLSKFHSDEWMRENQLLEEDRHSLRELLRGKRREFLSIVSVDARETVEEAIDRMQERAITQMPVRRDGEWVGRVTESDLMTRVLNDARVLAGPVEAIMGEPFPIIPAGETSSRALELMKTEPGAVLLEEEGKVIGILTKADLVHFMVEDLHRDQTQ